MSAARVRAPARTAFGLVLHVCGSWVLVSVALFSCSLVQAEKEVVDVQVGNLTLTRWDIDPDRYCVSVSVYNGTAWALKSFALSARVDASAGDVAVPDETIAARLQVNTDIDIAPNASRGVDVVFRSPLAFVPPGPITLSEIRFHSFRFDEVDVRSGEIVYPYPLREE